MKPIPPDPKVQITRTGLHITADLTFDEWQAMATRFGAAMSSAAFVIGDWLVYGEDTFRRKSEDAPADTRVSTEAYDAAVCTTGLDRSTLATYAYVARRVPPSLRNEHLSWEHHKTVAKLEPEDQERWLSLACSDEADAGPVSTRRLRKSITAGRLLGPDEMTVDAADRGQPNHMPFLNRLSAWWSQMKESGWTRRATPEQKETLKRDLNIVLRIINEIG